MSNLNPFTSPRKRYAEEHSMPLFFFLNTVHVILAEAIHKVSLLFTGLNWMTIPEHRKIN